MYKKGSRNSKEKIFRAEVKAIQISESEVMCNKDETGVECKRGKIVDVDSRLNFAGKIEYKIIGVKWVKKIRGEGEAGTAVKYSPPPPTLLAHNILCPHRLALKRFTMLGKKNEERKGHLEKVAKMQTY